MQCTNLILAQVVSGTTYDVHHIWYTNHVGPIPRQLDHLYTSKSGISIILKYILVRTKMTRLTKFLFCLESDFCSCQLISFGKQNDRSEDT